jgi:ABC-type transport system substrate-binding protein
VNTRHLTRMAPNESNSLANRLAVPITRRWLARSMLAYGASIPAFVALLAACADDDAEDEIDPASQVDDDDDDDEDDADVLDVDDDDIDASDDPSADDESATEEVGEDEPRHGGVLRYAFLREPPHFDPHIDVGSTSWTIQANVYDQLIDYDENGEFEPALAESWEVAEDRIYRFELRRDVTFHNGSNFTAHDVVFSIDRIRDPETSATLHSSYQALESYEAIDDFEVELTLSEPFAPFLEIIAHWASAIISEEYSSDDVDYSVSMNGTGPFVQDTFETDVRYLLVKNEDYWKPGLPYLDAVEQRGIADESARVAALRADDVDFIGYCPWHVVDELEQDDRFQAFVSYFLFNCIRLNHNSPPLDDIRVRQALSFAIDRELVDSVAFGGLSTLATGGLVPPDSPFHNRELHGFYDYNPDRARELLAEAGFDDPSEISINLRSSVSSVHFDSAEVVAQSWSDLGIQVELESQESATLVERRGSGDFQAMFDGLSPQYGDPDFYSVYFQTGGAGYAASVDYSRPELDDLLHAARTTVDEDERQSLYYQVEEFLLEDLPFIFLFWRPQVEAMWSRVQGYVSVPNPSARSESYHERLWLRD